MADDLLTLTGSQPTSVLYIVQMCSAVVMSAIDSVVGHKGKNMYQMLLMNGWTHGRGESWHGPRLLAVMADPVVVVEESQDGDLQCWERMEAETQFVQELMALQHKMWSDMKKLRARAARAAQNWDDWALREAMDQPPSPRMRMNRSTQTSLADWIVAYSVLPNDVFPEANLVLLKVQWMWHLVLARCLHV